MKPLVDKDKNTQLAGFWQPLRRSAESEIGSAPYALESQWVIDTR